MALTTPRDGLYEWILPEGVQGDAEIQTHRSELTFHFAPVAYIEVAKINAYQHEDKTEIGTLLEWANKRGIPVMRAIAIVLEDEYDVKFGERDDFPR